jgi:hypothetical protein
LVTDLPYFNYRARFSTVGKNKGKLDETLEIHTQLLAVPKWKGVARLFTVPEE